MKYLKSYREQIDHCNESVRDLMTPKSEEDIKNSLSKLNNEEVFNLYLKLILGSDFDTLHRFIKYSYDINVRNNNKETLLMEVCKNYHLNTKLIERFITEFDVDIDHKDRNDKTALIHAVDYDRIENIKTLIKLGVNLKKHNQGAIALQRAIGNNKNFEIIQSLINAGVDVNYIDHNHSTPLIYACLQSRVQVVELLLSKGADINIKNENGMSALMVAATRDNNLGSELIIKMLLDAGADSNLKNNNHQDAIDCALAWKKESNANLIKNYKSKTNESVRDLMTPKSSEEIKKSLDDLDPIKKYSFIKKHDMDDLFNKEYINKKMTRLAEQFGIKIEHYKDKDDKDFEVLVRIHSKFVVYMRTRLNSEFIEVGYSHNEKHDWDDVESVEDGIYKINNWIDEIGTSVNESVRDLMTGKTPEEVRSSLDKLNPIDRMEKIKEDELEYLYTEEELNNIKEEMKGHFRYSDKHDMIGYVYGYCVDFFDGNQDAMFKFIQNKITDKRWSEKRLNEMSPVDILEELSDEELLKLYLIILNHKIYTDVE